MRPQAGALRSEPEHGVSNRPEDDPIGHAAKFLWLFALIPVIFGSMRFFLPSEMSAKMASWQKAMPFAAAALIALVGEALDQGSGVNGASIG